jgi:hypothetical protein
MYDAGQLGIMLYCNILQTHRGREVVENVDEMSFSSSFCYHPYFCLRCEENML